MALMLEACLIHEILFPSHKTVLAIYHHKNWPHKYEVLCRDMFLYSVSGLPLL